MKINLLPLVIVSSIVLAGSAVRATAAEIASDLAKNDAYSGGWSDGSNGGDGFGPWATRTAISEGDDRYAGFFIASPEQNPDLGAVGTEGRAFGIFANGKGFEEAAAFREFSTPLKPGDKFSVRMKNSEIVPKYDTDDAAQGAVGFTLRSGMNNGGPGDYNADARFEFSFTEGETTYSIHDGGESHDSGVPLALGGVRITFTLVDANTYNLEVEDLATGEKSALNNRKLGGTTDAPLASFVLFSRDGEKNDLFFDGITVQSAE